MGTCDGKECEKKYHLRRGGNFCTLCARGKCPNKKYHLCGHFIKACITGNSAHLSEHCKFSHDFEEITKLPSNMPCITMDTVTPTESITFTPVKQHTFTPITFTPIKPINQYTTPYITPFEHIKPIANGIPKVISNYFCCYHGNKCTLSQDCIIMIESNKQELENLPTLDGLLMLKKWDILNEYDFDNNHLTFIQVPSLQFWESAYSIYVEGAVGLDKVLTYLQENDKDYVPLYDYFSDQKFIKNFTAPITIITKKPKVDTKSFCSFHGEDCILSKDCIILTGLNKEEIIKVDILEYYISQLMKSNRISSKELTMVGFSKLPETHLKAAAESILMDKQRGLMQVAKFNKIDYVTMMSQDRFNAYKKLREMLIEFRNNLSTKIKDTLMSMVDDDIFGDIARHLYDINISLFPSKEFDHVRTMTPTYDSIDRLSRALSKPFNQKNLSRTDMFSFTRAINKLTNFIKSFACNQAMDDEIDAKLEDIQIQLTEKKTLLTNTEAKIALLTKKSSSDTVATKEIEKKISAMLSVLAHEEKMLKTSLQTFGPDKARIMTKKDQETRDEKDATIFALSELHKKIGVLQNLMSTCISQLKLKPSMETIIELKNLSYDILTITNLKELAKVISLEQELDSMKETRIKILAEVQEFGHKILSVPLIMKTSTLDSTKLIIKTSLSSTLLMELATTDTDKKVKIPAIHGNIFIDGLGRAMPRPFEEVFHGESSDVKMDDKLVKQMNVNKLYRALTGSAYNFEELVASGVKWNSFVTVAQQAVDTIADFYTPVNFEESIKTHLIMMEAAINNADVKTLDVFDSMLLSYYYLIMANMSKDMYQLVTMDVGGFVKIKVTLDGLADISKTISIQDLPFDESMKSVKEALAKVVRPITTMPADVKTTHVMKISLTRLSAIFYALDDNGLITKEHCDPYARPNVFFDLYSEPIKQRKTVSFSETVEVKYITESSTEKVEDLTESSTEKVKDVTESSTKKAVENRFHMGTRVVMRGTSVMGYDRWELN